MSSSSRSTETPPNERPQLFIKKLHQCRVLFDFNDANAELKGKQIKAQTLREMVEYISTQRGVITENIYPEVVNMVRHALVLILVTHLAITSMQQISSAQSLPPSIQLVTPLILKRTSLSLS